MKLLLAAFCVLLTGCALFDSTNVTGYGERSFAITNALSDKDESLRVFINNQLYKDGVKQTTNVFYIQPWNDQNAIKIDVEVIHGEVPLAKFSFIHNGEKRELNEDPKKFTYTIDDMLLAKYRMNIKTNN